MEIYGVYCRRTVYSILSLRWSSVRTLRRYKVSNVLITDFAACRIVVMLRYIENIEISISISIMVSYRITRGNIEIFDIPVSTFWYIILPNFHVLCQKVVIFLLKLSLTVKVSMKVSMKISRFLDTTRENLARESLIFFIVRKFRKILH